jgi:hypothetical protein
MLGGSIRTIKKNTENLLVCSKKIGLEVKAVKSKDLVMSRDQNAGWCHNIKTDNNSFEIVENFKYLWTTLTNQNYIQEEIKNRQKSGNACYHSVRNLLSSSLQSKNVKIKIYRNVMLPVVCHGCEIWSLSFRAGRRRMDFEYSVLMRIFGPKRDEVTREW